MSAARLHQIDALRGIAALSVAFVYHQHYLTGERGSGPMSALPILDWITAYGWTLVDLFFVVSGYIFAHVYLQSGRMESTPRAFFVARFARLYPLHLATLLVMAALLFRSIPATYTGIAPDLWHFALNLLMLQRSGLEETLSYNVPSWSIAVEVYCYLVFYYLARRVPHMLVPLAIVICLVAAAVTAGDSRVGDHIARGFCGFFAGVLAYRFRERVWWPALIPFALIPLWLVQAALPISKGAFLGLLCWPAWVLLAGRIALLSARPFRWLGARSYAIYLIHMPIYMTIISVLGPVPSSRPEYPFVLLGAWAAILLCSEASFRYLEDPARRYLRDRLSSPRAEPGAASATAPVGEPVAAPAGDPAHQAAQPLSPPASAADSSQRPG